MLRASLWVVAAAGVIGLMAPAASAGVDAYVNLAGERLRPAPLVPTYLPPALGPIGAAAQSYIAVKGSYSIRFVHYEDDGPDAIIALDRGRPLGYSGKRYRSMRATLARYRKSGYRVRGTRVRGRAGYAVTRVLGGVGSTYVVWREGGWNHSIGTGTTRKVSLADLRKTAASLDPLEREYIGGPEDPEDSSTGLAVTTRRTISLDVEWQAACTAPGETESRPYSGGATVELLRRSGSAFQFDIAGNLREPGPWTGTVSGTILPDRIVLTVAAAGVIGESTCTTAPLTLVLDQRMLR
jgi:hypothetical protein